MAGGFHPFQLLYPLLDREFSLVVMIFSEKVAVFATQVAPVGYVDRTHRKLRQTKDEQFGYVAQLGQFSRNVHKAHYAQFVRDTQLWANLGGRSFFRGLEFSFEKRMRLR